MKTISILLALLSVGFVGDPKTFTKDGVTLTLTNFEVILSAINTDWENKVPLTAVGQSAGGNPANVTNALWSVAPPTAGTFDTNGLPPGADTWFIPVDNFVGDATVSATGEDDLGNSVAGQFVVTVANPLAASIEVTAGAPILK